MGPEMRLDLSQTSTYTCPQCKSAFFEQSLLLRKMSKFLSGTDTDAYIPISVINCKQCGLLAKEALDPRIRQILDLPADDVLEEEIITPEPPSPKSNLVVVP